MLTSTNFGKFTPLWGCGNPNRIIWPKIYSCLDICLNRLFRFHGKSFNKVSTTVRELHREIENWTRNFFFSAGYARSFTHEKPPIDSQGSTMRWMYHFVIGKVWKNIRSQSASVKPVNEKSQSKRESTPYVEKRQMHKSWVKKAEKFITKSAFNVKFEWARCFCMPKWLLLMNWLLLMYFLFNLFE